MNSHLCSVDSLVKERIHHDSGRIRYFFHIFTAAKRINP